MTLEHAAVRETLVKTTLKLMEKGGLETVKARHVAELSGVSVGTIYNLFGNFDGLILAASIRIYEELKAVGLAAAQQIEAGMAGKAGTPRERMFHRLSALAEAYVGFVSANANRWNGLLSFNRSRGLAGTADNLQHLADLMDIIGRMLEEAPRWTTPAERRVAARALWSAVHGIVITNFSRKEEGAARARTSELLDVLLGVVVDGMFAEPAAA